MIDEKINSQKEIGSYLVLKRSKVEYTCHQRAYLNLSARHNIDFIIFNIMSPKLSYIAFIRQLKEANQTLPLRMMIITQPTIVKPGHSDSQ
ncbi:hypothetical protein [Vibrio splendidus]|uniref:hypothetical protein n=1 Tax=Vibrio splendidus TaxID=29497 RepID=UPI000CBDFFF5|nr:hypothetical protein [Vibrio splendidus]PMI28465.1 hypothetical protein BCU48_15490 [Vibrio splendidus]PMM33794.1 hypothetical protein BCT55_20160 [Vibrio splendidus]PMO39214.1 hypothetical protein BCT09_07140 [Vibrio splendidus]